MPLSKRNERECTPSACSEMKDETTLWKYITVLFTHGPARTIMGWLAFGHGIDFVLTGLHALLTKSQRVNCSVPHAVN